MEIRRKKANLHSIFDDNDTLENWSSTNRVEFRLNIHIYIGQTD